MKRSTTTDVNVNDFNWPSTIWWSISQCPSCFIHLTEDRRIEFNCIGHHGHKQWYLRTAHSIQLNHCDCDIQTTFNCYKWRKTQVMNIPMVYSIIVSYHHNFATSIFYVHPIVVFSFYPLAIVHAFIFIFRSTNNFCAKIKWTIV